MLRVKDGISSNASTATKLQTARTINGTSFDGSANITTANWGTARTLTIGSTGKSVNGSANVSWTLAEIGAAASSHNHDGTYMKQANANGYYGMTANGDASAWVRTTNSGIIPYQSGGASSLGTSSWPFTNIYANNIYDNGVLLENKFAAASHTHNYAAVTHTHSTVTYTSLASQTTSLNNYNLSSGFEHVAYFYCPTDGGGENITGRPNDSNKTAFNLKVELLRWASTTDYISKQTYTRGAEKVSYVRYCTNGTWSAWEKVYTSANKPTAADIGAAASSHTHNYAGSASAGGAANSATILATARTINGTSFNGSANITTANWGTARTITIGSTGKSVNGSANVSWSLSEIGAAAASHTHSYLALSGGTLTGAMSSSVTTSTHLAGNKGTAIINSTAAGSGYTMLAKLNSTNGVWTLGNWSTSFDLFYTANSVITADTNSYTKRLILLNESGNSTFPGTVAAAAFSGSLSGNASTATTLQTARTINGTSFNGSANITTANWGTARTITIGNTGKSVNGSGNVSWSLSEIGAAAASHTHSYAATSHTHGTGDLTSGTLPVSRGGTGSGSASGARTNLGIVTTKFWSGSLSGTSSITLTNGANYNYILVGGRPGGASCEAWVCIPRSFITTSTQYTQVTTELGYIKFGIYVSGSNVIVVRNAGSGNITMAYGGI